jgi:hypothetical protein
MGQEDEEAMWEETIKPAAAEPKDIGARLLALVRPFQDAEVRVEAAKAALATAEEELAFERAKLDRLMELAGDEKDAARVWDSALLDLAMERPMLAGLVGKAVSDRDLDTALRATIKQNVNMLWHKTLPYRLDYREAEFWRTGADAQRVAAGAELLAGLRRVLQIRLPEPKGKKQDHGRAARATVQKPAPKAASKPQSELDVPSKATMQAWREQARKASRRDLEALVRATKGKSAMDKGRQAVAVAEMARREDRKRKKPAPAPKIPPAPDAKPDAAKKRTWKRWAADVTSFTNCAVKLDGAIFDALPYWREAFNAGWTVQEACQRRGDTKAEMERMTAKQPAAGTQDLPEPWEYSAAELGVKRAAIERAVVCGRFGDLGQPVRTPRVVPIEMSGRRWVVTGQAFDLSSQISKAVCWPLVGVKAAELPQNIDAARQGGWTGLRVQVGKGVYAIGPKYEALVLVFDEQPAEVDHAADLDEAAREAGEVTDDEVVAEVVP